MSSFTVLGYAVAVIICKLGFGILPLYCKGNMDLLGFANAFSSGVFIASSIIHLLPEAVEGFAEAAEQAEAAAAPGGGGGGGEDHDAHMHASKTPYIFCMLGFVITAAIEKVFFASPNRAIDDWPRSSHAHSPVAYTD